MRALILLHRWLGVAFCLLFAMWFASGIVIHFVPFPAPDETERIGGLAPIDAPAVRRTAAQAIAASGISDVTRLRLMQRSDGPIYLVTDGHRVVALHAADLSGAAVGSQRLALAIAGAAAERLGLTAAAARLLAVEAYDQWTMAGSFDRHRPLYRIALDDAAGTEFYVSSSTGEIVLTTDRRQRGWNYVGSIAHWIYPTVLRAHPAAWRMLLWSISLLALIGATAGAAIGVLRIGRGGSPYSGWQKLHHWLGLTCGLFLLSFIFSGWLSMDDGRLFSTGKASEADRIALVGAPSWDALGADPDRIASGALEEEWFAFGGRIYRRDRVTLARQSVSPADAPDAKPVGEFLAAPDVDAAAARLGRPCAAAVAVASGDAYAAPAAMPGAPVYRVICGTDWYDIDGSDGMLVEKRDASRRAYRWLYDGLHRLDFPPLTARPALRSGLIVVLCGFGIAFSLTAAVIAWRRLAACL